MGYFSNGTEGVMYEEQYCSHCVHHEPMCQVWLLHMTRNYEECNRDGSILHQLIPRSADGLVNYKCTMFRPLHGNAYAVEDDEPSREELAVSLKDAVTALERDGRKPSAAIDMIMLRLSR